MLCKKKRKTEVLLFLNRYLLTVEYSVTCLSIVNKNYIHVLQRAC